MACGVYSKLVKGRHGPGLSNFGLGIGEVPSNRREVRLTKPY